MLIKEQIQSAILEMMKDVKFDPKKHVYERVSDGAWLQGVSTVSSIVPKDWLAAWGAKECVKFLGYSDYEGDTERAEDILKLLKDIDLPHYQALLKDAKGASARKSKTALVDGAKGHGWLETMVLASIRGQEAPKIPEGTLERPLTQFVAWAEKEVDYWIASEARVAYPEKGYAGTLDALAMMKTGKLAVIDFKFASHISEDYFLQTAGYQATFEPYEIKFDERIIVRLPKTLEREEYDKITHKYSMIPNDLEVKVVDTEYKLDRDAFFAALVVKRWINAVTK